MAPIISASSALPGYSLADVTRITELEGFKRHRISDSLTNPLREEPILNLGELLEPFDARLMMLHRIGLEVVAAVPPLLAHAGDNMRLCTNSRFDRIGSQRGLKAMRWRNGH